MEQKRVLALWDSLSTAPVAPVAEADLRVFMRVASRYGAGMAPAQFRHMLTTDGGAARFVCMFGVLADRKVSTHTEAVGNPLRALMLKVVARDAPSVALLALAGPFDKNAATALTRQWAHNTATPPSARADAFCATMRLSAQIVLNYCRD